jgi:hypothetical protein
MVFYFLIINYFPPAHLRLLSANKTGTIFKDQGSGMKVKLLNIYFYTDTLLYMLHVGELGGPIQRQRVE